MRRSVMTASWSKPSPPARIHWTTFSVVFFIFFNPILTANTLRLSNTEAYKIFGQKIFLKFFKFTVFGFDFGPLLFIWTVDFCAGLANSSSISVLFKLTCPHVFTISLQTLTFSKRQNRTFYHMSPWKRSATNRLQSQILYMYTNWLMNQYSIVMADQI